ncbi:DUF6881 domain-containing protein [Streptomyces sp. NPDC051555]|uniref:DUF6881 domain-containing protein n=1 Tax=Streptomyces sp. NPDC051555 TaxID=3365657 RepID=UPI003791EB30
MEYWKVEWLHEPNDDPTTIYSEIGPDGYETRKVHRYTNGRMLKSDDVHESLDIGLSEVPVGEIKDVNKLPYFTARLVTSADFQRAWDSAGWPST